MTASPSSAGGTRSVVVGLFDRQPQARQALEALRGMGVAEDRVGVLSPGQSQQPAATFGSKVSGLLALAGAASDGTDVSEVLRGLGVPDGEARFYAREASEGRTLVVVAADGGSEALRKVVLEHGGYDVQSRGGDFIRGDSGNLPDQARALPVDVTKTWEDFRSRYQMLWQQHYGTTDATFEQLEPIYRYAWQLANDARFRGRPWSNVEPALRRDWESSRLAGSVDWSDAAGPIRDVWEDVTQEAATGAEGGADRRIASPGTDQSVAARDVLSPDHGAA